jgi:hypothetical protein
MPVEFTNGTLDQMLLGTRDVMARGKILDDLLTNPTTLQKTSLGIGEAPFEVGNNTVIRRLTTEVIRVLEIKLLVGAACNCMSNDQGKFEGQNIPTMMLPLPLPSYGWPLGKPGSPDEGAAAESCAP